VPDDGHHRLYSLVQYDTCITGTIMLSTSVQKAIYAFSNITMQQSFRRGKTPSENIQGPHYTAYTDSGSLVGLEYTDTSGDHGEKRLGEYMCVLWNILYLLDERRAYHVLFSFAYFCFSFLCCGWRCVCWKSRGSAVEGTCWMAACEKEFELDGMLEDEEKNLKVQHSKYRARTFTNGFIAFDAVNLRCHQE
jgi:hypothetical protein